MLGPGKNRTVTGGGVVLRCRTQTESVLLCFCPEVSRHEAAPSGEPCWRVGGSDGQSVSSSRAQCKLMKIQLLY